MNHGGKRKGAGRKSQYQEPTETVSFRIPISLIESIKSYVKSELDKLKK